MFGRRKRDGEPQAAAVVADIRRTIARLDDQRRSAAAAAGRALVNQAEVERACDEQLRALAAAFGEAENAETLARRAVRGAADDDPDRPAFERTADGLRVVQDVLGAAAEPIHALLAGARENVVNAQQVLARARAVFDEQVREQVRLLRTLERAEQQRVAREFRQR